MIKCETSARVPTDSSFYHSFISDLVAIFILSFLQIRFSILIFFISPLDCRPTTEDIVEAAASLDEQLAFTVHLAGWSIMT